MMSEGRRKEGRKEAWRKEARKETCISQIRRWMTRRKGRSGGQEIFGCVRGRKYTRIPQRIRRQPPFINYVRQTNRQTDTAHTQTHCLIHHFAMRCHIICIHTYLLHLTHLTHSSSLSSLLFSSLLFSPLRGSKRLTTGTHTHTQTLIPTQPSVTDSSHHSPLFPPLLLRDPKD